MAQLFRHFADDALGPVPSDLSVLGDPDMVGSGVVATAGPSRPNTLRWRATNAAQIKESFFGFGLPSVTGDNQEALLLAKLTQGEYSNGEFFGPTIHSSDGATKKAYHLRFRHRGGTPSQVAIVKHNATDWTKGKAVDLVTLSFAWSTQTYYYMRLRREGTALMARVWASGQTEPTAWSMTATDPSPLTGGVPGAGTGQHTNGGYWTHAEFLSAADGGASAPSAPVETPTTTGGIYAEGAFRNSKVYAEGAWRDRFVYDAGVWRQA